MKSNYNIESVETEPHRNRDERRALYKRLQPKIKRIVELEKQIKEGINKDAAEDEMTKIIESCTMIEMFAIEDYIYNKNLLDNK